MTEEIQKLFDDDVSGTTETRRLAVLTRHGRPLLYLPRNRTQALRALSLYQPQRTPARIARGLTRLACTLGLVRAFPSIALTVGAASPLCSFLLSLPNRKVSGDTRPEHGECARPGHTQPAPSPVGSDVSSSSEGSGQSSASIVAREGARHSGWGTPHPTDWIRPQHDKVPSFAILAGNPNTPGRRFILLFFDALDRPALVVKAGITPQAIRLLEQEAVALEEPPSGVLGLPRLYAVHRSPQLHALALEHIPGEAPQSDIHGRMAEVLGSWVNTSRTVTAREVPAWQRLVSACPDHAILQTIRPGIESAAFHPVIHHGDFAPWNIKVARDGSWKVLDWERGEPMGLPCWDWFHYQIQVSFLVERIPAPAHAEHIEAWLAEKTFKQYATRAGADHILRELLLAYLLHSLEVTRPSEGLPATRDLLNVLAQRWNIV